ncbi:MAG TPA: hypothetical protein PLF23_20750 [Candidatus Obscuribacter sp.]|nr:hypothetical protein [Candidatus Obscuribacter sp.]
MIASRHRAKRYAPSRSERRRRGAALLLFAVLCVAAFASSLLAGASLIKLVSLRQRTNLAVEAAALAAASDLSTLVIDDPEFGYLALSDFAPTSAHLIGQDGKPLPVTGINTLLSTTRANLIVARHLNNETFLELARLDAKRAREAAGRLQQALAAALSQTAAAPLDKDGKPVRPRDHARAVLLKNLAAHAGIQASNIDDFKIELGTSDKAISTTTPLLVGENAAQSKSTDYYQAFVNTPVGEEDFHFFAVGKQTALTSATGFRNESLTKAKGASLVRVSVKIKQDLGLGLRGVQADACAMPFALEDKSESGTLVLGLPQGLPAGYNSLQDLLSDNHKNTAAVKLYSAVGGDYPLETCAYLSPYQGEASLGDNSQSAKVFALGLYDWLRTAHGRFHLASVLNTIGMRIQPSQGSFRPGESLVYRLDNQGKIAVDSYLVGDLSNQVVHENQIYTMSWNAINATNGSWNLAFRDQVRNLGKQKGGKHAGQLMECDGSFRKLGTIYGSAPKSRHQDQERKAYFDGGLAVEFVLTGSPQLVVSNQ